MDGKIGLEEHFAHPDTLALSEVYFTADVWPDMRKRLLDMAEVRLKQMDQYGMEYMIVSLNSPAIQAITDKDRARDVARRANDLLAEHVQKRWDRFRAFAALPMQEPDEATTEAYRCVRDLSFVGALVNGYSQIGDEDTAVYLDDRRYRPFWAEFATLDVPFYLHPRDPLPSQSRIYEGHPWLLGSAWAFNVETATHALRLMGTGLFDEHPRLTVILGHLGEGLPFLIWRIDHRLRTAPRGLPAKQPFSRYLSENFFLTTSGNFRTQTLIDTMLEVSSDRILFSADYPFERVEDAATWFDVASISETDRLKIGRANAAKLFKIGGSS
ncbi:MAG: amidohydrolase [Acetobacteraceae bacterium]|nr:amidohydrolase [Acetobacteraceae bacterium]